MADIKNLVITAHIDHGKSTLADRFMEITKTVESRRMREQLLDSMELEREKGITIKLQPVRMQWKNSLLNLIDTPGHVDFQYEVSRSLQAVEGALLLVDATQGVQAQTVSNLYLALEQNLEIIAAINKVDLPAANVERVKEEIEKLVGIPGDEVLGISAKTGEGVPELLDYIVEKVPTATVESDKPLRALIFDSVYDDYKGVVAFVRIVEGQVSQGSEIAFVGTEVTDRVVEIGTFAPQFNPGKTLSAGEIGYIATGLKDIRQARVGDTIVLAKDKPKPSALPGFKIPQPKVFAGIFPVAGDEFPVLREAMGKLQLNDASLTAQQERSQALGQGFRCGFLGMLHLEIVQERLRREFELDLVVTTPSVLYKVKRRDGTQVDVHTPDAFPDPTFIESTEEQFTTAEVIVPTEHLGAVFELMKQHEGEILAQEYMGTDRVMLKYEMPLRELVVDLYDELKSATSGYGSLSYEIKGWRPADVVKLAIMLNHEPVEALSVIIPRSKAEAVGRRATEKLKDLLPRQLFALPIQAAVGGKVVARETLPAMRKDVTAGLYGGDVTRKRKVLEKQKKGKKKMATTGSISIPPEAYIAMLKK